MLVYNFSLVFVDLSLFLKTKSGLPCYVSPLILIFLFCICFNLIPLLNKLFVIFHLSLPNLLRRHQGSQTCRYSMVWTKKNRVDVELGFDLVLAPWQIHQVVTSQRVLLSHHDQVQRNSSENNKIMPNQINCLNGQVAF